MPTQNKYQVLITTVTILLIAWFPLSLLAQAKYTTVLTDADAAVPQVPAGYLRIAANGAGTETARSLVKFNLNNLPQNAKVSMMTFRLYVSSKASSAAFSTQPVTAVQGPSSWAVTGATRLADLPWTDISNNTPIGIDEVTNSTQSINLKLKLPAPPRSLTQFTDGYLTLAARSPEKSQDNYFYSSNTAETPGNYSKKPKLIIKYEVDPYPKRSDWAQPFCNAQHNSGFNWYTNATTDAATFRVSLNQENIVGADPTGALSIYNGYPIIFTQATSGTSAVFYVKQLGSNRSVRWSKGVNDVAKCWPLIDEKGRLYYFTQSTLSILDLNNKGEFVKAGDQTFNGVEIKSLLKNQATGIRDQAAIGYDGTLYLSTDKGIIALSAFPQFKILWKYDLGPNERCGPVSLTPDESKAFFISVNTLQGYSQLKVLDNSDGTVLDASANVLGSYRNDENNYYIPAPVVQSNSRLFVLNGFDNSSKLFVFDLANNRLTNPDVVDSKSSINNGISQPAIDADLNVYFVYNNKIACYDISRPDHVNVLNSADYSLNTASILIADASHNIYAYDPYNLGGKKITGFKFSGGTFTKNFTLDLSGFAQNLKKNIALASDGTLYTVNQNTIIAIGPGSVSQQDVILTQPTLKTNTVYRANRSIVVNGFPMYNSIDATLYSGGSISFKPGFSVQTGARLSCKTGY